MRLHRSQPARGFSHARHAAMTLLRCCAAALLRCCCYCREIRSHIRAAAIARKLQQRGHNLVRLVLERFNASSMRSRLCRLNGDRQTLMACCEQSMI
jgi:hypothetical protein